MKKEEEFYQKELNLIKGKLGEVKKGKYKQTEK